MAEPFELTADVDMTEVIARGELFMTVWQKHLESEFKHVLALALRFAKARVHVGKKDYVMSPDGQIVKAPGGMLRRSLATAMADVVDQILAGYLGVAAGSPAVAYARMEEIGGVITPKKGKYLRFSPDGEKVVFALAVHRDPHPYLLPTLLFIWPLLKLVPESAFIAAKVELGM